MNRRGRVRVEGWVALVVLVAGCASGSPELPRMVGASSPVPSVTRRADGGYEAQVAVNLSVTPQDPAPGQRIDLRVALASAGAPTWSLIDWGDGTRPTQAMWSLPPCSTSRVPATFTVSPPASGSASYLMQHYYRRAGAYRVVVEADHVPGCPGSRLVSGTGREAITVTVAGAAAAGNGIGDPDPEVGVAGYTAGQVSGDLEGTDRDGYVRRLSVTWPGGATQTLTNPAPCSDPATGWPSSQLRVPFSRTLAPGTYTIALTATSTDCQGGTAQTITVLRRIQLTRTGWTNAATNRYTPRSPNTGYTDGAIE